ncbi:MAG: c-type cytochrome [Rhodobacteraceae bacterium]|nr:c-type cytochrome [Paracoccaceae bacterium]
MSKFLSTLIVAGLLASSTAVVAGTETTDTTEATEATTEAVAIVVDEALALKGKKVFKKCKACHKVGEGAKNGVGPLLNGIYGAEMAANADFKYSKGMKARAEESATWTDENMREFLTSPKKYVTKTKMSFKGVKEKDMDAIIEFLKSVSM